MKVIRVTFLIILFCTLTSIKALTQQLAVNPYAQGLNLPIDIKHCGDERLFVVERSGAIRIVNADGTLRPKPFLDISSKISSVRSEEGFLGMTFSPDYKNDGKFFVDYTTTISGQLTSVIEQYQVDPADSNRALTAGLIILTQSQPYTNHNGGNLMFGKDGYLFVNIGDGGSGGDPQGNGQNLQTFLGKILRIDVTNSSPSKPYEIPVDNPFFNNVTQGIKKEIWGYGLRNPWRSSMDRVTGDLWIADVGQGEVEEIDVEKFGDAGGRNYGWNIMEGTSCYSPPTGCNRSGIILPVYEYSHAVGRSVTGGYVFRSVQSRELWGTYLFADYVAKWIDGIKLTNDYTSGNATRYITAAQATGNPVSFGEDMYGDQYILFNNDGTVYKLEDSSGLRYPKAYFTILNNADGSVKFNGLKGRYISYQWLLNGNLIDGATSPDLFPATDGIYRLIVTNTLGNSDTSDALTLGAVATNILSFTASKNASADVILRWNVSSENSLKGYDILRSVNDPNSFKKIGAVDSKSTNGTSTSEVDYSFIDTINFSFEKLYYRLQLVKQDGSFQYSNIISIKEGRQKNSFTVSPNPSGGQFILNLDEYSSPLLLAIYDIAGKKMLTQQLNKQITPITVNNIRGVYIMQVSDPDGKNPSRKKVVVL